ncbi:DUF2933 domain-containing protein [Streptomyces sp. NPDC019990]|uniref:DUF2933 domain-containing protein n=1 Tax=Streptomyces sp. NPDC019990 TaxID=3154693 RepID=UPI0033E3AC51
MSGPYRDRADSLDGDLSGTAEPPLTKGKRNYGMYALAAAIVVVGVLFVGAPMGSLVCLALVAACPLMMFFMMRGMHGCLHKWNRVQRAEREEDAGTVRCGGFRGSSSRPCGVTVHRGDSRTPRAPTGPEGR